LNAVTYAIDPPIAESTLNALFARARGGDADAAPGYGRVLARSLLFVAAFVGERLVGFANVATDGGVHAFLLDPTVDPEFQRQGIGTELVRMAAREAMARGCEWLHVDYEPQLEPFYRGAGFRPTSAGVMHLDGSNGRQAARGTAR
jgi:ribosomal protein S18 acetylase RimI-like enzyme